MPCITSLVRYEAKFVVMIGVPLSGEAQGVGRALHRRPAGRQLRHRLRRRGMGDKVL